MHADKHTTTTHLGEAKLRHGNAARILEVLLVLEEGRALATCALAGPEHEAHGGVGAALRPRAEEIAARLALRVAQCKAADHGKVRRRHLHLQWGGMRGGLLGNVRVLVTNRDLLAGCRRKRRLRWRTRLWL